MSASTPTRLAGELGLSRKVKPGGQGTPWSYYELVDAAVAAYWRRRDERLAPATPGRAS